MSARKISGKNGIKISVLACVLAIGIGTSCDLFAPPVTFTTTYNGNGHTSGSIPNDSNSYEEGATVTVLGNTGSLMKTGCSFAGWNTASDGTGTERAPGSTFAMGAADVTLYVTWTVNNYTITFDKNDAGATGTMADQTITSGSSASLTANEFANAGWEFTGWATTSGGSVALADQESYTMGTADVTLYATWAPSIVGEWLIDQTYLMYTDTPPDTVSITQNITVIMNTDGTTTWTGTTTWDVSPPSIVEGSGTYIYDKEAGTLDLIFTVFLLDGVQMDMPIPTYNCEITETTMTLSVSTVQVNVPAEAMIYTRQ